MIARYTTSPTLTIYIPRDGITILSHDVIHHVMLDVSPLEFASIGDYMAYDFGQTTLEQIKLELPSHWQFAPWDLGQHGQSQEESPMA